MLVGSSDFASEREVLARARLIAEAAGRSSVGEDDIGLVLMDVCDPLVRGLHIDPAEWRTRTLRYLGPPHPAAATGEPLDATATTLLNEARLEANRAGRNAVDATHLLVALLREDGSTVAANARSLGLTAARLRDKLGYPPHRRPFAGGADLSARARAKDGSYVLLGGGRLTESLPRGLAEAATIRGRRQDHLRVAVIGATNRWGGTAAAQRLHRLGVEVIDTNINDRDDANAADLAHLDVDAIYVPGGDPARGADALLGTPAAQHLADLAERGVVMMGTSAGATIWGSATLSSYVSEGDAEPVPMVGFLENTVVVAHHLPGSPRLPDARHAFPRQRIIAVGHEGAIRIHADVVTEVVRGDAPCVTVDPTHLG